MASIHDSIRSVFTDNYALLKMSLFSCVIFGIQDLIDYKAGVTTFNLIIAAVIAYFYIGYIAIIINNRINQKIETLPTFNIIKYFKVSTSSAIIAIPYALVSVFVVNFVVGLFNFESISQYVAIWIIRYFVFSMFITALIIYAEKFNLKKAMDLSKILNTMADVLVYTAIGSIVLAIFTSIAVLPTLYLIYTFFKINPLFLYISSLSLTMILSILGDYWGQLHYDIESRNNYY